MTDGGYISEETLARIEKLNNFTMSSEEIVGILKGAWVNGGGFSYNPQTRILHLSTGGWGGCEEVIRHLQKSAFWMRCWWCSMRGGHHKFKFPPEMASSGVYSPPTPSFLLIYFKT